jgi:hypothetical protein
VLVLKVSSVSVSLSQDFSVLDHYHHIMLVGQQLQLEVNKKL